MKHQKCLLVFFSSPGAHGMIGKAQKTYYTYPWAMLSAHRPIIYEMHQTYFNDQKFMSSFVHANEKSFLVDCPATQFKLYMT